MSRQPLLPRHRDCPGLWGCQAFQRGTDINIADSLFYHQMFSLVLARLGAFALELLYMYLKILSENGTVQSLIVVEITNYCTALKHFSYNNFEIGGNSALTERFEELFN